MAILKFHVSDANSGKAIEGAVIRGHSRCDPYGGMNLAGSTDYMGNANIDDGCSIQGVWNATISAPGYQSQTVSGSNPPFAGEVNVPVELYPTAPPTNIQGICTKDSECPSGYICYQGSCIKPERTTSQALPHLLDYLKKNWLFIILFIIIAVIVIILLWKPQTLKYLKR